jgi:hypothetical protein
MCCYFEFKKAEKSTSRNFKKHNHIVENLNRYNIWTQSGYSNLFE